MLYYLPHIKLKMDIDDVPNSGQPMSAGKKPPKAPMILAITDCAANHAKFVIVMEPDPHKNSTTYPDINELSTLMSNMKVNGNSARTNALMASAETMGMIEQYGSVTDMSITRSTCCFCQIRREQCSHGDRSLSQACHLHPIQSDQPAFG
jgi:hypothetical protein